MRLASPLGAIVDASDCSLKRRLPSTQVSKDQNLKANFKER
jgi:hypothetical protein